MSRYKPYPEYKESGVEWLGQVPKHWTIISLKRVLRCMDGKRIPLNSEQRADIKGEIPYWGAGGIVDYIDKYVFDEEVILLGEDGAPFFERDKPVAYLSKGKSWINNHIHVLKAPQDFPMEWFIYYLNSVEYRAYIDGSTRDKLTQDDMKNISMLVPSSQEALGIVNFLERETARIDTLIESKTRFIELLQEKRQALITQAVTQGLDPNVKLKNSGVEWLGMVPEHWIVARFRDYCTSISTGPFGTALRNEDYVSDGVPVINPSHIQNDQCAPNSDITVSEDTAERLSAWRMLPDDIVAARRGELGRAAIVKQEEEGWICGTGSLRIRADFEKVIPQYLHIVLQSYYAREWLNQSSVGATMANLNEGILGALPVVVPVLLSEQHAVINKLNFSVNRLNKIEAETKRSIELLRERRTALITAAVTGQIDLRESAFGKGELG